MVQLHRANEEKYKTMLTGFRPCYNIVDFTSVSNELINIHSLPWLINTLIEYHNTLQLSGFHQGVRIRSCNNKVYYMVFTEFLKLFNTNTISVQYRNGACLKH